MRDKPLTVYAMAIGAVVLWGGTPIANKAAVAVIDPATAGLLRSAIAGLLAVMLALAMRLPWPSVRRQQWLLVFSGLASFAAWPLFLSLGLGLTTANHAALLIALIPVFTGLIASAVDRTLPPLAWWGGMAIAAFGTAILIGVRSGEDPATSGSVVGDLIILVGVVACAAGYVAGGKLSPVIGTWATTFWGLASAAIVLVPAVALLWTRTRWTAVGPTEWLAVGYMALISSLAGYAAWFWALGRGGITRISAWQLGQPVLTLVFAVLLLGEVITWPAVVAGAAIVAGTALTQLRGRAPVVPTD
jgi:drug/metabolite transporter (DMT)-like permease